MRRISGKELRGKGIERTELDDVNRSSSLVRAKLGAEQRE